MFVVHFWSMIDQSYTNSTLIWLNHNKLVALNLTMPFLLLPGKEKFPCNAKSWEWIIAKQRGLDALLNRRKFLNITYYLGITKGLSIIYVLHTLERANKQCLFFVNFFVDLELRKFTSKLILPNSSSFYIFSAVHISKKWIALKIQNTITTLSSICTCFVLSWYTVL